MSEKDPAHAVILDRIQDMVEEINQEHALDGKVTSFSFKLCIIATLLEVLCKMRIPKDCLAVVIRRLYEIKRTIPPCYADKLMPISMIVAFVSKDLAERPSAVSGRRHTECCIGGRSRAELRGWAGSLAQLGKEERKNRLRILAQHTEECPACKEALNV